MANICCALLVATLAVGCSSTSYVVEPSSVNPFTEMQLRGISGEEFAVEFYDGRTAEARELRVLYDSCMWVEAKSNLTRAARTKDVRKVTTKGHLLGVLEGMGIGVLAGTLVTVAITSGKPNPEGGNGLAFLAGWLAGGTLGAVWGGIVGHSYEYEFVWKTTSSKSESDRNKRPE